MIAGEEDVAPALADHWQDVSAAFRDRDARHLYVDADDDRPDAEAARKHPAVEHRPGPAVRVPALSRPISQARSLKEAEPELEKLQRSGYRTVVTFARRGEGERAAYNLGRLKVHWLETDGGSLAAAA